MAMAMKIWVNEQPEEVTTKTSLRQLRDWVMPGADILIRNGFLETADPLLKDGDRVVFIRRGEIPSAEELEMLLVARHTPGVHKKIKTAKVGIAGIGGLGSTIAIALARSGVGQLIIADFDIVEPSNLNRQQYFVDQIWKPKVEALCQTIARINPYVSVMAHQVRLKSNNIPILFAEVDVMVEAFDSAEQKALLTEAFRSHFPEKPLVVASGVAGYGSANDIRTRQVFTNLHMVGDEVTAAAPGTGLMAPLVGVAAHHQANAVLRLLLQLSPT